MTRHAIIIFIFVAFVMVISITATANTLSDTYNHAFVDPHGFDKYLDVVFFVNKDYYEDFERCSSLSFKIMEQMERQLRQKYSTCRNNAECTQIAKDIQSVVDIRVNVTNLVSFIHGTKSNPQTRFLDSQIGQAAIYVYNFHRQRGIDLRRNPEFIKTIKFLSNIPCQ
jgi:hypothetical protein